MKLSNIIATAGFSVCVMVCFSRWSVGWSEDRQSKPTSQTQATQYDLKVTFRGPWGFVEDPKNQQIIAIAPDVEDHSPAFIRAIGGQSFQLGVYKLVLDHPMPAPPPNPPYPPPNIVTSSITKKQLDSILQPSESGVTYAIVIPMTDNFETVLADYAKVSAAYPVKTTQSSYTDEVSLHYLVNSLKNIALSGTDDTGGPVNISLDSGGTLIVGVNPPDIYTDCDDHAKGAFHELENLFAKSLYVDFPPYDQDCQDEDPQNPDNGLNALNSTQKQTTKPTMKASLLGRVKGLETYAQTLPEEPRREIVADLTALEKSVETWSDHGPTAEQQRQILKQFHSLQLYVRDATMEKSSKSKILEQLKDLRSRLLNAAGNNCKAPQMDVTIVQ